MCWHVWNEGTPEYIIKLLRNFKNTTCPDVYGVSVKILKDVIEEIAYPITRLINSSMAEGVFPDSLKIARVVPVYKKGDKSLVSSYRPIAIIPALSKIFEAVMKEQLLGHFERNNLFSDAQHGFRRGRSTASALLSLSERVLDALECGDSLALTLCDLSKAFDVVSHELLISKLRCYGIGGEVLSMFTSYLHGRRQIVSVGGAQSRELEVRQGVPQGSILGPLLFLILVNDLDSGGMALLFADDTTLLSRGQTPELAEMAADADFVVAGEWFSANGLCLNEEKTQRLVCSLRRGVTGDPVKLLGFMIDTRLSWEAHIDEVCKKLSRIVFLLRRLRSVVTEQYLLTAYYALFHSHISYGILLWGHASGCDRVLKLQKAAVRVMTASRPLEHCRPIFAGLGLLTVFGQYILTSLVHVRDNIGTFEIREDVHSYNTRGRDRLNMPRRRLAKSVGRFPVLAMKMYNDLPRSVKLLSRQEFVATLRDCLTKGAYYSVEEFVQDCSSGRLGVGTAA